MTELRPQKWCQLVNNIILDADGWDRKAENFEKDWNKPISFSDYVSKSSFSTTKARDKYTHKLMYNSMIACHIFYFGKYLVRKNNIISGVLRDCEAFTFNLETNEIIIKGLNWTFSTTSDNILTSWIGQRIDNGEI